MIISFRNIQSILQLCAAHPHSVWVCTQCAGRVWRATSWRVCGECVCEKYQVCGVQKSVQIKKLQILINMKLKHINVFLRFYSNSTTNLGVIWHHTCISYKAFYFWVPSGMCWCWCSKIFKNHKCVVRECAERKVIVCRVCGCTKISCTQILWNCWKDECMVSQKMQEKASKKTFLEK